MNNVLAKAGQPGQPRFVNGSQSLQLERKIPLAPPTGLNLRFWGTRGSIPVSGPAHLRYGGNTSCVSLTSDTGHLFIFDAGSGARDLGNFLLSPEWNPPTSKGKGVKRIEGYLLLSHTHWDHIQGFPFFGPVFRPGSRFNLAGWSNGAAGLAEIMAGQMEQKYFPVSLYALPAELGFYALHSEQISLEGGMLTGRLLKHPLPSLGYRLELGGKTVVYATDHEPQGLPHPQPGRLLGYDVIDRNLVELAAGADVLIHDAQYSNEELGQKVGWGHNTAEIAVDTAIRAGVRKLVLFHHDPAHDDATVDSQLAAARGRAKALGRPELEIIAAWDGLNLEL